MKIKFESTMHRQRFVLLEAFAVAWLAKSNVSIDRSTELDYDGIGDDYDS